MNMSLRLAELRYGHRQPLNRPLLNRPLKMNAGLRRLYASWASPTSRTARFAHSPAASSSWC